MTTDNILAQYVNTPQAIGERYYFYATDEGRMPTAPCVKTPITLLQQCKKGWPPPTKWERYFIQWEEMLSRSVPQI